MREILFRAKAKCDPGRGCRTTYKKGEWIYGLMTSLCDGVFATMKNTDGLDGIDIDPETIGQFTGFMDSEQNKIFEGDIIEIGRFYNNNFRTAGNYLCRYDPGSAAFVFTYIIPKDISSVDRYALLSDSVGLGDLIRCSLKVIGNIYDNPELLSEESECV